jgi:putative restriction endonuclease
MTSVFGASLGFDARLRAEATAWLDRRAAAGEDLVTSTELSDFQFEGQRQPLVAVQQGIWKPRQLDAALSIRTTFTRPGAPPPYEDAQGPDGLLRYKYRGTDPQHYENRALRRAMNDGLPLIWFVGIAPGVYLPRWPVWLVADEPEKLQFVVAVDLAQRSPDAVGSVDPAQKQYVERLTRLRLHQPVFRARVLSAYEQRCAICRLRHAPLLDAAHITPDTDPRGLPVVPNGLALCKIHHAAYDQNIIGVRPDLVVDVRADILAEIDGPMLLHGIQEMKGIQLTVPRVRAARPDRQRLDERYEQFRRAG